MSELKFAQRATITFATLLLLAGCVSQKKYNALDEEYQQLQQSMGAEVGAQQMQITRLQNAIKVNVNGELLFPVGRLGDAGPAATDDRQDGGNPGAAADDDDYRQRLYR
jgi:outer membrane murein-binding lipoprotein Lpp